MPIDPRIALGVQQLQVQDPLAQYGKVAAIQSAQNQNALAQYQLAAAQREQETTNALNKAYASAYNPQTGEIDANKLRSSLATGGFGSKLPAVEKGLLELGTARTAQQKAQSDLVDAKLKQSRAFLENINPMDPNAPQQYLAWHQANHADPVLGPVLKARGITAEQSLARINDAIAKGPQAFAELIAQSKLGTEKFMELNKPQLSTKDIGGTVIDRTFQPLTGTITEVGRTAKTMSSYQQQRLQQMQDRLNAESAVGVLSPDTLDFAAQIYAQTGALPPLGIGKGAAQIKAQILNRAAQIAMGGATPAPEAGVPTPGAAPGASATPKISAAEAAGTVIGNKQTVAAQSAALKSFNTGVEGRAVRSFNTAIDHLDTMDKLATALVNNDIRVFNSVGNAFAAATGNPAPTNFDAAKAIVGGEVAKALTGSNMALKDREEIRDTLARANSPEQLRGVIRTMQQLMGGQLKSLDLQYSSSTGRKDFDKKLTSRSKEVLKSLESEAAPSAAPASSGWSIVK